jgi:hypothetical protein
VNAFGHVAITGHLSRRMLEPYSHIRIDAKRQALDALDVQRGRVLPAAGNGGDPQNAEIRAVIARRRLSASQVRETSSQGTSSREGVRLSRAFRPGAAEGR